MGRKNETWCKLLFLLIAWVQAVGLWDFGTQRMKHNTRYFSSFTLASNCGTLGRKNKTWCKILFLLLALVQAVGLWDFGTQRMKHNTRYFSSYPWVKLWDSGTMGRRVWNIIQDTFTALHLGQPVGLWDYGTQSMKHNTIYFSFLYPWFKLWDSETLGRREWNIILDTVPPLPLGQTVGLWDARMIHNTRYFSSFNLGSNFGTLGLWDSEKKT